MPTTPLPPIVPAPPPTPVPPQVPGPPAPPPPASQPDTIFISSREEIGHIGLFALGPPGAAVIVAEQVGDQVRPLAARRLDASGRMLLPDAETSSCERRVRRFLATVTPVRGTPRTYTTDIRTPSCTHRITVRAPKRSGRGRLVHVRIVDRWGLGDRKVRLCVNGGHLGQRCSQVALVTGSKGVTRRFRPRASGQLRVVVSLAGHRTTTRVAIGSAKPLPATSGPVLLTTGDSTIEGIDSALETLRRGRTGPLGGRSGHPPERAR